MDTSAKEISFDKNGICNFCFQYQEMEKERKARCLHPGKPWTIHEIKKVGGEYDAIVGLSGGVDSSMVLHCVVTEWKLHPLCFSVDNGWNNPIADENVMKMVEKLKVPFFKKVLDLKEFTDLQMAFLRSGVMNVEIPTDHVLMAISYKMAVENGIKFIINGGNLATEGIMPKSYGYQARDLRHIRAIFKRFMDRKLKKLPTISLPQYIYYRFVKGIRIIQPLDFYEYKRTEAIKLLEQEYGYKNYGEKHEESHFTKWFQNFYLPVKFKIDKRRAHFSSMINSGQMSRAEALVKLNTPMIYPQLGIENRVLEFPIHSHFDYPTNFWLWNLLSGVYRTLKEVKAWIL